MKSFCTNRCADGLPSSAVRRAQAVTVRPARLALARLLLHNGPSEAAGFASCKGKKPNEENKDQRRARMICTADNSKSLEQETGLGSLHRHGYAHLAMSGPDCQ